jgi:hypothetical protein
MLLKDHRGGLCMLLVCVATGGRDGRNKSIDIGHHVSPDSLAGGDAQAATVELQFVDKTLNNPNRIVLSNVVVQAFRQQYELPSILALDKTLHPSPL